MISNMQIFEAVAARRITPHEGADLMLAMDRARAWWGPILCEVLGHAEAVAMLPDKKTGQNTWMCPRCGAFHQVIGGTLPPLWCGTLPRSRRR